MPVPGIGDVFAVTELCWRLYRQVYQVYRDAPTEIDSLAKDLSSLTNILKSVQEDIQQPESILSRAGSSRVATAVEIVQRTGELLNELEKLLQKYEKQIKLSQSRKSALRASWAKFKYTKDARKLVEFRAKIDCQAGQLTLLLLSSNNSSLERLLNQNDKIATKVDEVQRLIQAPTTTPDGLSLEGYDDDARHDLNMLMLQNSEINGDTWSYIGFEDWLQACQWWLMKAQAHLHLTQPGDSKHIQAYLDLLKASWIFSEILTWHPQRKFASSGQQNRSIQRLGEVLKAEHTKYNTKVQARPTVQALKSADFTVWGSFLKTSIFPNSHAQNDYLRWSSGSGEIVYQRFGYYKPRALGVQLECIILLNLLPQKKAYRLVAQTPDGRDALQLKNPEPDDFRVLNGQFLLELKSKHVEPVNLFFLDFESYALLKALLEGASLIHSDFPESSFSAGTVASVALLNHVLSIHQTTVPRPTGEELEQTRKSIAVLLHALDNPTELTNHAICVLEQAGSLPKSIGSNGIFQKPATIVSLLAWVTTSTEDFRGAIAEIAPDGWDSHANETIQAAILLDKPLLVRATLDIFNVDPKPKPHPVEDGFDELSHLVTEHFDFISTHLAPRMIVWTAFQWSRGDFIHRLSRCPLKDQNKHHEFTHAVTTYLGRAILTDDIGPLKAILENASMQRVRDLLEGAEIDPLCLSSLAIRNSSWKTLEYILRSTLFRESKILRIMELLSCGDKTKANRCSDSELLMIPAILSLEANPIILLGQTKMADTWVNTIRPVDWPLLVALRLARHSEVIEVLVSQARNSPMFIPHRVSSAVRQLAVDKDVIMGQRTFKKSLKELQAVWKDCLNNRQETYFEAPTFWTVTAYQLGLKIRRVRWEKAIEIQDATSDIPPLPPALRTQEAYDAWRTKVLRIFRSFVSKSDTEGDKENVAEHTIETMTKAVTLIDEMAQNSSFEWSVRELMINTDKKIESLEMSIREGKIDLGEKLEKLHEI